MKINFKPICCTLALSAALLASPLTFAKPDGAKGQGHRMQGVFKQLELTDEQRQQIRELMPRGKSKARGKQKNPAMRMAFSDNVDTQLLNVKLDGAIAMRKAQGLASAQHRHAIRQILTDEQEAILDNAMANRDGNKKRRPMLAAALSKLELTEAQSEAIAEDTENLKVLREEMKSLMGDFRASTKPLITADSFDTNTWLAQYDQYADLMKAKMQQSVLVTNELFLTLDETQQKKLKKMLAKKAKGDKRKGKGKGKGKGEKRQKKDRSQNS